MAKTTVSVNLRPSSGGSRDTDTFPIHVSLPTLTEAHVSLMARDIHVSEVHQCIKDLKVGERPCPDSFTVLYYRTLADVIPMYNSVKDGQTVTSDLSTANIVMLPKPDHSSWANFRPISLINIDMKILTQMLANRLNSFLPSLVKKDQVKTIKGTLICAYCNYNV